MWFQERNLVVKLITFCGVSVKTSLWSSYNYKVLKKLVYWTSIRGQNRSVEEGKVDPRSWARAFSKYWNSLGQRCRVPKLSCGSNRRWAGLSNLTSAFWWIKVWNWSPWGQLLHNSLQFWCLKDIGSTRLQI